MIRRKMERVGMACIEPGCFGVEKDILRDTWAGYYFMISRRGRIMLKSWSVSSIRLLSTGFHDSKCSGSTTVRRRANLPLVCRHGNVIP